MNEATKLAKREPEPQELESRAEPGAYRAPVYGYGLDSAAEGEVHLLDYWRAVRKRLWLVFGIAALITAFATIYVARKPDVYEAKSQVEIGLENNPMYAGKTAPFIYSPVSDPTYFNTQLQILTGPGLLRRVVKTLDLEHNEAFLRPQSTRTHSTWQSLLRMFGLGGKDKDEARNSTDEDVPLTTTVAPATSRDDLAEAKRLAPYVTALLSGLKVEPVKETRTANNRDTRLIDIRFDHADPQIAARVVNAIADAFVRTNLERKTETGNTTGDFLQKRIAELQSEIRSGEEQLSNYAKSKEI